MNEDVSGKKASFLGAWEDAVGDVCYYDRKGSDLTADDVDMLIEGGHVTVEEIVGRVRAKLIENYPNIREQKGQQQ